MKSRVKSSSTGPEALIWTHSQEAPSFRRRMIPLARELSKRGWRCRLDELPKSQCGTRIINRRHLLGASDLLVLHGMTPSPPESSLLRTLAPTVVLDVDDAGCFASPYRSGLGPGRDFTSRKSFNRACELADLVITGNRTLHESTKTAARQAVYSPTPINLDSPARKPSVQEEPRTLVWIGPPESVAHLEPLRPVLARLAARYPDLKLRVLSSSFPEWSEIPVEIVHPTAEPETNVLIGSGIGIMPPPHDKRTREEYAFTLLRYMAAGLPFVGFPIGADGNGITDTASGFLASTLEDWERALGFLLEKPDLAARMGASGRRRTRRHFDVKIITPRLVDLIEETVDRNLRDLTKHASLLPFRPQSPPLSVSPSGGADSPPWWILQPATHR